MRNYWYHLGFEVPILIFYCWDLFFVFSIRLLCLMFSIYGQKWETCSLIASDCLLVIILSWFASSVSLFFQELNFFLSSCSNFWILLDHWLFSMANSHSFIFLVRQNLVLILKASFELLEEILFFRQDSADYKISLFLQFFFQSTTWTQVYTQLEIRHFLNTQNISFQNRLSQLFIYGRSLVDLAIYQWDRVFPEWQPIHCLLIQLTEGQYKCFFGDQFEQYKRSLFSKRQKHV